jgi:isoquinoline 1-oxidoreductase beta subunit
MSAIVRISRRKFLRHCGMGAGALALGCYISPYGLLVADVAADALNEARLNNFVFLDPTDGTITIMSHRSEMGQGIRSSLAAVLADELEADWNRVILKQADADLLYGVPFPLPIAGEPSAAPELVRAEDAQSTESSRSMALFFQAMRLFGTGIRLALVRAGARHFEVAASACEARQHKVWLKASGRSLDYGDPRLLLNLTKVPIPTLVEIIAELKTPDKWRFIGGNMPFIDARDMVTGKAVYGADVEVPGRRRPHMLTATIVRCPVANGTLKTFDAAAALAVKGVKHVVPVLPTRLSAGGVGNGLMPHAGVAVLAENTWAALQGRKVLRVDWDLGPNAVYDSEAFRRELETSTTQPGKIVRQKGDVDAALAQGTRVLEAGYYVPHLAQAPMEPPVATAVYENGQLDIWCPTQAPELTQRYVGLAILEPDPLKWLLWQVIELFELDERERESQRLFQERYEELLAKLMGVDHPTLFKLRDALKKKIRQRVRVHVPLLGGSFGRKLSSDYALEAAFLAQQFPGIPIRVQWTREDDLQFSYYGAVSHQYLKATLDADGHATGLLQRSAFTSIYTTFYPPTSLSASGDFNDLFAKARVAAHNGGEYPYASSIERAQGLEDMPFDLPNLRIENCPAQSHIRTGCVRSAANIYHAFAIGSFADELAIAAGRDSKDYLLALIGKGHVFVDHMLNAEGVRSFENNGFPVEAMLAPVGERLLQVYPAYPPDTRRLRAVVQRVAKESGWDEKIEKYKQTKGRGLGIAAHRSFLSYVAMVIDVSLSDANELTINEIHGVIDCGFAVNPDRVYAQMEGGILYGLSLALFGEITVKKGAVEQSSFDDYRVLRIKQAPKKIFVHVMPSEAPPTGVGEPPVPPVAPALANAIVAAGGPRIRELPFHKKVFCR